MKCINDLTNSDLGDLIEGLKECSPKVWVTIKKDEEDEIIDHFLLNDSISVTAEKFKMKPNHISDLLIENGIL